MIFIMSSLTGSDAQMIALDLVASNQQSPCNWAVECKIDPELLVSIFEEQHIQVNWIHKEHYFMGVSGDYELTQAIIEHSLPGKFFMVTSMIRVTELAKEPA